MSEQLITPPSADDNALNTDTEGWHRVADEYKNWHPGLHPYVESQLAARGIVHAAENQEQDNSAPDIERLLNDIATATDDPEVRKALRAERRHESSPELETILDTVIGIKLQALERNDDALFNAAGQTVIAAHSGDEQAQHIASEGLATASVHGEQLLKKRQKELLDLGYTPQQLEELGNPEQLGYQHLSLVHATDYLPRHHESDGLLHIGTSFEATGLPRNTLHVALNHMVESAATSSDWSAKKFIIVAPLDKTIELNGEPSALIAHDTWWEAAPRKGLTLAADTLIVRPGTTKPVSVYPESHEVRYKSHDITSTDIDELVAMADGYELSLCATKLGIALEPGTEKSRQLKNTSLEQHITELDTTERAKVVEALHAALATNRDNAEAIFADIAKRTAVRKALELQGREVIEPLTIMEGSFRSEDISTELHRLRRNKAVHGHHSNTELYYLEKRVTNLLLNSTTTFDTERDSIRQQIKDVADELSIKTLQMYYRLGLF